VFEAKGFYLTPITKPASTAHLVMIIFGSLWWLLVLAGLVMGVR